MSEPPGRACFVSATVGFSIESANIVGFQNYDIVPAAGANKMVMTADTFIPVGEGSIKLGQIVATPKSGSFTTANFHIMMIGLDGNPRYVKDDAQIAEMTDGTAIKSKYGDSVVKFVWVTAKNAWYLSDDSAQRDRKYPMTDYPIPHGAGFLIYVDKTLSAGVSLTYSGAVKKEALPLGFGGDGVNEMHVTANIAPTDIKLSEVVVAANAGSLTTANFHLMMVGDDGNPRYVKNDAQIDAMTDGAAIKSKYGESVVKFVWVTAKNAWYLSDDSAQRDRKYPMTDYVIPAGAGFLSYTDKTLVEGVTLTLPSAIEEDAK